MRKNVLTRLISCRILTETATASFLSPLSSANAILYICCQLRIFWSSCKVLRSPMKELQVIAKKLMHLNAAQILKLSYFLNYSVYKISAGSWLPSTLQIKLPPRLHLRGKPQKEIGTAHSLPPGSRNRRPRDWNHVRREVQVPSLRPRHNALWKS